jgi:hypothetical protein
VRAVHVNGLYGLGVTWGSDNGWLRSGFNAGRTKPTPRRHEREQRERQTKAGDPQPAIVETPCSTLTHAHVFCKPLATRPRLYRIASTAAIGVLSRMIVP